ncbi:hypothetical protein [Martelella mangrovi]|uniref:Uncharacterized protein n=1 Tax=Martelella mangrovi TaxID=1397477 RepID=A0ABV2IIM1_9HYPH
MTRTLIGLDYAGVASVKVSTDAYDPATTPDTTYGAWLYNSKFDPIRYCGAELIADAGGAPDVQYFPVGTGESDYQLKITNYVLTYYNFRNTWFDGLYYSMPIFSKKIVSLSGRFSGRIVRQYFGYEGRSGYLASTGAWQPGWYSGYYNGTENIGNGTRAWPDYDNSANPSGNLVLQVWNLPGNAEPIRDPPLDPVSGQTSVIIDSTTCRVAKPGYDANTASESELAFDSSVLPIKVVAANDVAVPSGVSSVPVGAIPDDCLVDVHFYSGSNIYYPVSPFLGASDPSIGAEYWLSGGQLHFDNSYGECRARYMVYASNNTGPTYGDNDVLRQFNDGTRDVVQFLRPGAGADPSFADIILDTRWPALRIVKQGYIPITADGYQEWSVSFDAGGAWPFVKYMTVHGSHYDDRGENWSAMIREPYVKRLYTNRPGSAGGAAGDTTYCRLSSSEARFYTYRGNPVRMFYADFEDYDNRRLSYWYDEAPIQGIRYYIFGIPQP